MQYWLDCWKKYAVFSGRSRRKEYWMFCLFNFLISFGIGIVSGIIGARGALSGALGIVSIVYSVAAIIPGLAVFCRRMHDTGRSGWWWLIGLVPLVGAIVLLVFLCSDSQPGENKYGPNPKG